ncbi:MAG: peptide ABC transporter substrate-binding protein [Oscillospiraceae bacterium]|nr:peptide ABC transporter substrate-binding protein [Oscillospiraceae bacterium]
MKKILALVIVLTMLAGTVLFAAGCGQRDEDDKGATLLMYMAGDPSNLNLDPGLLIYSSEAIKFMGLLFEGMTVMDDKGKLHNGMAKNWTITENEELGIYRIEFELKETRWSDGKPVTADDFVYAWKRILEPEFSSPAAALLFSIRNARAVKEGDMTVDDLGVYADDLNLLRVEFERKIDYDKFLENLASPYLVPLRSDTVDFAPDDWAKKPISLYSNGPFSLKQIEYNKIASFDRSTYYMLPGKKGENIFKYVTPFRISLDFSRNLEQITNAYNNDDYIFYLGDVPKDRFGEFASQAEIKDLMSSYVYYFNTDRRPFNDPNVRKALSIALDRNEIAKLAGLGVKPATGIVPHGVVDAKSTEEFRKVRGDAISPSGNLEEARRLLSAAGVTSGSFELSIRRSEVEKAVADYAAGVWGQLGFNVTVRELAGIAVHETIFSGEYDVMAYDMQAPGVDAWSVLAPFAKPFSGGKVTFLDENQSLAEGYITGFQNDAYDALIEEIALLDNDYNTRTARLFEAEKMLVDLSPVAPLFFNTSINITDKITGLSYSKFGHTIFTKANLKNYHQYTTGEEE